MKVYRILDANLNRVREGLRVTEEITRFVLEDEKLTLEVKKLRGRLKKVLAQLPDRDLLSSRQALKDVGSRTSTRSEISRGDCRDIFKANIKRTQEALRSLEEFSKLIKPQLSKKFKSLRFAAYELEKIIERDFLMDFDLYVITDKIGVAREALKAGARALQLRDKSQKKAEILRKALRFRKLADRYGATFLVNDHIYIAKRSQADGVHLGQEDVSIRSARKILGPYKIIGRSSHSLKQALKAQREGADYLSCGPIFRTPTKPNKEPVGLKLLRAYKKRIKVPVVAIGGIDLGNVGKLKHKRFAVIRAVEQAKNIGSAVKKLRAAAG